MNEKGSRRKEWVKTAAIVFLSVMLVLTFFSSTIMNYSLPEVATQYVEPGTITAKIRGGGVIESNDPYEVMVKETRKVTSVAVKSGDAVQQGDVLLYLEDTDSEELKTARKALEDAEEAYDLALLSAEVNASVLQGTNSNTPTMTYRQQITNAQNLVKEKQKKVDEKQKQVDELAAKISTTPANSADKGDEQKAYDSAKAAKEKADFDLTAKDNALTTAQSSLQRLKDRISTYEAQIELYQMSVSAGDAASAASLKKVQKDKQAAEKELPAAQNAVLNAQAAKDAAATAAANAKLVFDKAETALNNKIASGNTEESLADLRIQQNQVQAELNTLQKEKETAEKELTELLSNINKTLNLKSLYDDIEEARENVQKQEEKAIGGTVKADIAGTVTTINATAGKEISAAEPVAVIQPEGKGFTMQFSVTNDQAKRLAVGDVADLVNAWRYDDVTVTLASIKPDKSDPGQKKLLTFNVSGNATAGQTINVSVGQKSANYDLIVPNSAVREDNNGKFILIVQTKSTPLNNRYIASRVDVEVLASDDTRSAISGALYGYEYVITTSTAPVEAGKQVRLASN